MHQPVMVREVLAWSGVRPGGVYLDATVGAGGHAEAMLDASAPDGRLLGLDADPSAIERAGRRLRRFGDRCTLVHAQFGDMAEVARAAGFDRVQAVLMDLGISSDQLDDPSRGLSFAAEGPLDMRTNPQRTATAADLVNGLGEEDLAALLKEAGDEPDARRIARAIVRRRLVKPIRTTTELAEVVSVAKGGRRGRTHPATQTFMALRVATNREAEELHRGLPAALDLLAVSGRLLVIAFQSAEDRVVKDFLRAHAGRRESLQQGGERWTGECPPVRVLTRKPARPAPDEVAANPRARSALLRAAERIEGSWSAENG